MGSLRQGRGRKSKAHIHTTQAEEIEPTKEDAKLLALYTREKRAFKKRGSSVPLRQYTYIAGNPNRGVPSRTLNPGGVVNSRETF